MGELAAVMAHEVRNPLGAISNAIDALRRGSVGSGTGPELLDILREEADRLSRIVDGVELHAAADVKLERTALEPIIASAVEVPPARGWVGRRCTARSAPAAAGEPPR